MGELGHVTGSVTDSDHLWELANRIVQDRDVISDGVRSGVARAKDPRECLAGGISEAEHRMEAVATLVVGSGAFLVLGVDLDERGVDVEDNRVFSFEQPRLVPDLLADLGQRRAEVIPRRRTDLVEGAEHRRVRGDRPEQVSLKRRCSMSAQLSPPPASIRDI